MLIICSSNQPCLWKVQQHDFSVKVFESFLNQPVSVLIRNHLISATESSRLWKAFKAMDSQLLLLIWHGVSAQRSKLYCSNPSISGKQMLSVILAKRLKHMLTPNMRRSDPDLQNRRFKHESHVKLDSRSRLSWIWWNGIN